MSDESLADELTAAVDRAGLLLWRLNREIGVYSGATMEFSIRLFDEPWPITLRLDGDGDVVWPVDDDVRVVVHADGRLARAG